ncbi:MAG TPA: glycosyltransferase family 9 protein [Candidatus Dormibacteraeota bacterium]|nr:glycosyltransferase family 9 protein [Candidatus Dormibacteraeota bacterium]
MSTAERPVSSTAILLGGGVREALMAQSVVRTCEGATVFASVDAMGTLLGLASVGRTVVFDASPAEPLTIFRRLRTEPISTIVVPFPGGFIHAALAYFSAIPRRLIVPGPNDWAATERLPRINGEHPVEANWRLAVAAINRPTRMPADPPRLQPPVSVRNAAMSRWPGLFGTGRPPLVLVPGGGGWSAAHNGPLWPAERFAVVANQAAAERIVLVSGVGDDRAARETRAGIVKPTTIIKLTDLTVEELAAVSELSVAVVGHDSDGLHVAAAAGAQVIAVARRSDLPPKGERVVTCWVDDYDRFPARQVTEVLSRQARVDTYA